jgi:glycogen phosphorylase/synthase
MTIKPDYLFEVSWEVCNKVGGIHTVVSTKALSLVNELRSNYILIGPDVWRDEHQNPEFIEDKKLFKAWRDKAFDEGLRVKVGRWNITGKPAVIIVDFTPFIGQKDAIFSKFWETYKLDSISGQWDYVEPSLFGYAAGKVIESFTRFNISIREKVVAQFHEWMTGSGLLYLHDAAPQIGTIFTTHATAMGRAIAGNMQPLYGKLTEYNADAKAIELGIVSKQSMEKLAAQTSDCFTTVSEITGKECTQFLEKSPDIITPNGFEDSFVPKEQVFAEKRISARKKLTDVTSALLGYSLPKDVVYIATSGRYEYHNKGVDVLINALHKINQAKSCKKDIVVFLLIPANHYGARKDILNIINKSESSHSGNHYLTHNLHYSEHDPVLRSLEEKGLKNRPEDCVKVIFVPSYLNGNDGIFDIPYYDLLIGFDLSIFPSYYEPWGYTPLESIAFHVPTITTSLAGFGLWMKNLPNDRTNAVWVVERTDTNEPEVINEIQEAISVFCSLSNQAFDESRQRASDLSKTALWSNLINYYYNAYNFALQKVALRVNLFLGKERTDVVAPVEKLNQANSAVWKRFTVQRMIPNKLKALEELSKNLWWCWNYDAIELFQSIDPELWIKTENNPIVFLDSVSHEKFKKLENNDEFIFKLNKVFERFNKYLKEPVQKGKPRVAYFSMEFGLHDSLKIFSGGLGLLAGDYLKEASDFKFDIIGIGLLYRYGYFKQVISGSGDQISTYDQQQFSKIPAEPVRDDKGNWLKISIIWPGRTLHARIWKVCVGRIPLYLLDTDFDENLESDRSVTHHLYGGDWENRLKQELLLGIGGIRLLDILGIHPDLYHCNEGHAAFIGIERLRKYIVDENLTFAEAMELVRASTLFTTHTPVPAGHDAFDEGMLRMYAGHYPQRMKISWNQFIGLGRSNPDDPNEKFSMSFLAANLSQEINGVSRIHGRVSQEIFRPLYKGFESSELHIGYVTNGVHMPSWTAKAWMDLYKKEFGENFLNQQEKMDLWNKIYDVPNSQIWKLRNSLREKLINYVKDRMKDTSVRRFDNPKLMFEAGEKLNKNTLTIGFARRFATYKRAHLLFTDLDRLAKIVNNPSMPIQFIFAGKAHPHDRAGQDLIRRIVEISKMPEFLGRIVFVSNYEIGVAKMLVSGVDIWLNTPTRPLEASGTSGEKAVMNGVLHFSVLDGWWGEGYVKQAGWALPEEVTYDNPVYQDQLDAETIYSLLENEIAPLYYFRDEEGIPSGWVNYIKNCIAKVAPNFTMNRQLRDYDSKFYSRMFDRVKLLMRDEYYLVKEVSSWKKRVKSAWESIDVISVSYPELAKESAAIGASYNANLVLNLNELSPDDIAVELVLVDYSPNSQSKKIISCQEFVIEKNEDKIFHYKTTITPDSSGTFEYGIRIIPKNPILPHRQDFNYIRWIE